MDHPMGEHRLSGGTDGGQMPSEIFLQRDLPDALTEEESAFSRWTLPLFLFALTVFTTLWAGAYQAYSGTIRGPVAFLWEHPEMLPQGDSVCRNAALYPPHPRIRPLHPLEDPPSAGVTATLHSGAASFYRDLRRDHPDAGAHHEPARAVRHWRGGSAGRLCGRPGGTDRRAVPFDRRGPDLDVRVAVGRAAAPQVDGVADCRSVTAASRCPAASGRVCRLVRALCDVLESDPHRSARWRARGLCLVGKSPADNGLCRHSVADHVGIRRMAWVVHLGVHGGCLGHRSSAGR